MRMLVRIMMPTSTKLACRDNPAISSTSMSVEGNSEMRYTRRWVRMSGYVVVELFDCFGVSRFRIDWNTANELFRTNP